MSDVKAATPGNTAEADNVGTENTAISAADSAAAEEAAGTEQPKGDAAATKGKTAFSAAADPEGEDVPAGDQAAEKPDGEGEGTETPAEGTVVEQALSEVELPEGFSVSDADRAAVSEIAAQHKLGKDAVKDLIALQTKREQARLDAAKEATQAFINEMKQEAMRLPKETLVACNRFVSKYGSKSLQAKMADPSYYIGNDVDIIQALAIAQKAVDGGFVDGSGAKGGSEQSAGEKLYS
jgi:hypothetical protein